MSVTPSVNTANVVSFIVDTHQRWKTDRLNLEQLWKECFFRAMSRWPGGAMIDKGTGLMERFYHPVIENMVDTVTAQMCMMAVPNERFFTILARTNESESKADAANALLRWVHMKNHFKRELRLMVKQAVITGNAPWHCNWTVRKTSVPDQEKLAKMEATARQMQEQGQIKPPPISIPTKPLITYAGPDFFTSSIFDYVQDPWPEDPDRCMRMRRTFKSPAAVKLMGDVNETGYAVYENTDNITPGNFSESSDTFKQETKLSIGLNGEYEGKDKVEIIECYGDIPVTFGDDNSDSVILYNHIAVVANRSILLRLEPLPFEHGMMPCGMYSLIPRPGEPYGTGLVERCLGIQDAILERFNQSIIAHGMAINPMWFYKQDGLFDPDDFEAFPGALFPYANSKPEPFEVPDKAMEGFHEVALLKADISECAGSVIDMNTGGERSATETSLVASKGNARFASMVQDLEETINTVITQELSLCQQLLSDAVWLRVTHPSNPIEASQGREVGRGDIEGSYDIYCVAASQMANASQRVGVLVQTTQALAATPAAQAIDWVSYGAELFEMQGLTDASSRFFKSKEQMAYDAQLAAQTGGQPPSVPDPGVGGAPPSPGGAPGISGPAPVSGAPYSPNAQPHPAIGGQLGNPASLPGRRPLGA